jgi:hypothetical protein
MPNVCALRMDKTNKKIKRQNELHINCILVSPTLKGKANQINTRKPNKKRKRPKHLLLKKEAKNHKILTKITRNLPNAISITFGRDPSYEWSSKYLS